MTHSLAQPGHLLQLHNKVMQTLKIMQKKCFELHQSIKAAWVSYLFMNLYKSVFKKIIILENELRITKVIQLMFNVTLIKDTIASKAH